MANPIPENINWSLPEYEHQEKTNDWYWALGVVAVSGSIISVIYDNFLFAGLIILGAILMGYFGSQKPEIVSYEISNKGFKIRNTLYPYKRIKAFFVNINQKPTLFIKLNRPFIPVISVPIEAHLNEMIKGKFSSFQIPEQEMKEDPSEKILDMIGY